ncbi:MAG TPA: phosphate signaling complex protein PhoU [Anaerolineales bacterium]
MKETAPGAVSRAALDRELRELHDRLLQMGEQVDRAVGEAMHALRHADRDTALSLIAEDADLNAQRFRIEQSALETIATQQPAARDLRAITAAMSVVVDLERMGDHATGIAKGLLRLEPDEREQLPAELGRMAEAVQSMLRLALQAYDQQDPDLALQAAQQDDWIDAQYQELLRELLGQMIVRPSSSNALLALLFVGHNLERIADRVTNISERVIFMVSGSLHELNPEPDEASFF